MIPIKQDPERGAGMDDVAPSPHATAPAATPAVVAATQPWAGTSLQQLRASLQRFAAERDWEQYHTPRNLLLALTGEVGELAEIFQWRGDAGCAPGLPAFSAADRQHVGEELSDVLLYLVRLADSCGVDLPAAALSKLEKNAAKYPAHVARGTAAKYTELEQQAQQQQQEVEEKGSEQHHQHPTVKAESGQEMEEEEQEQEEKKEQQDEQQERAQEQEQGVQPSPLQHRDGLVQDCLRQLHLQQPLVEQAVVQQRAQQQALVLQRALQPLPYRIETYVSQKPSWGCSGSQPIHHGRATKKAKDPKAPKRPVSSYMYFASDKRKQLKLSDPGMTLGEIGKATGVAWQQLSEKDKEPYAAKAAEDNARYQRERAAYKGGA